MDFEKRWAIGRRWLVRFIGHSGVSWGIGFSFDVWEPGGHIHFGPWMLCLYLAYEKEGWDHLFVQ